MQAMLMGSLCALRSRLIGLIRWFSRGTQHNAESAVARKRTRLTEYLDDARMRRIRRLP